MAGSSPSTDGLIRKPSFRPRADFLQQAPDRQQLLAVPVDGNDRGWSFSAASRCCWPIDAHPRKHGPPQPDQADGQRHGESVQQQARPRQLAAGSRLLVVERIAGRFGIVAFVSPGRAILVHPAAIPQRDQPTASSSQAASTSLDGQAGRARDGQRAGTVGGHDGPQQHVPDAPQQGADRLPGSPPRLGSPPRRQPSGPLPWRSTGHRASVRRTRREPVPGPTQPVAGRFRPRCLAVRCRDPPGCPWVPVRSRRAPPNGRC